jgi:hypothetical protein
MSLVVESGNGDSNSESYISVADATTYINTFYFPTDPLSILWTTALASNSGAGTTCEIALRRSTRDLDTVYGPSYWSDRLTSSQALLFPREPFYEFNQGGNVYNESVNGYFYQNNSTAIQVTGIPVGLKQATVELALVLLNGFDITGPTDRCATIQREMQRIGSLLNSVEYFYASSEIAMNTRKVSSLMAPFISCDPSGINVTIARG